MGRFRVTVTKRSDEWAESNPPLEPSAPAPGRGEDPALAADGPHALGCTGNLDTPGYGDEGPKALGCTPLTGDPAGYGDGPISPLGD